MGATRLLLIATLATIVPGQVIRLPVGSLAALTLTDLGVSVTVIFFLIYALIFKKPLIFPKKIFYSAAIFSLIAAASTTLAVNNFSAREVIVSALFLVRFTFYFLITIVAASVIKKEEVHRWLNQLLAIGVVFGLLGILQVILIPDLSFLTVYGWDPHVNRLASSLIDPNYTGGLLTLFLALSLGLYLYKKNTKYLLVTFLFFASIILTFSRSSYLALLTTVAIMGSVKSPKIILVMAFLFAAVLVASPKAQGRIIGAFSIDETAQARIESWQNALLIAKRDPLLGVGFNTYRFAQEKYGNFSFDSPEGGHSGAGSDSSILLVLATTGIFGLFSFLTLLFFVVKSISRKIKSDYLSLGGSAAFIGILVHSQFVNALFYPQIMLMIWFLVGLTCAKNKNIIS